MQYGGSGMLRETFIQISRSYRIFPGSSAGKESACNAGDLGSIPGSRRSTEEGIDYPLQDSWAYLVAQSVKNLPTMRNPWVGKIPWRRAWQPSPVFLPGESPWTEEPGWLQSMGSQRVGHDRATKPSTAQGDCCVLFTS